MISLKRLTILLISILIVIILVVVFESSSIINIFNPGTAPYLAPVHIIDGMIVHGDNYNDSDGLTAGQKMDAILLAVNNSTIIETIQEYKNISPNRSIGPVTPSGQDFRSGYLDLPNVVNVPMQLSESFTQENIITYVDIKNQTVIGVERWWSKEDIIIDAPIPASAEWYHRLMGPWINASDDISRFEMHFRVSYWPEDAGLYPIIVDESNFSKYKNGSSFSAVTYVDIMTGRGTTYDGSKQVLFDQAMNGTAYWGPYMSFGNATRPYYYDQTRPYYYVILKNADNRTIHITNFNIGP